VSAPVTIVVEPSRAPGREGERPYEGALERAEILRAADQRLPFSARRTARVLLPVVDWVQGAHHRGKVVQGLRPELLFIALEAMRSVLADLA
jgi:hypothetical protein